MGRRIALAGVAGQRYPESGASGTAPVRYSTVTDFARLRGMSTLQPRITATW
jgi:hypothetical protein